MNFISKNSFTFHNEASSGEDQKSWLRDNVALDPVLGVKISKANSDPATTTVRTRTAAISQDLDTSLSFPSSSLHQDDEGGTSSQSTSRSSSISAIEPSVIEKTFATVGTQTDHLGKKLTEEQDAEKQGASHHDQVEEVQKAVAGDGVITASVEKISSASDELAEESIGLIKLSPEEKELYEEYKSKISNKDPREKLSAGLTFKKLLESLSSREHPDLESNFEKEPFEGDYKDDIKLRHIRDFATHHPDNFIISFDHVLKDMYHEDHVVFKQALTEYLVSREILTKRLGKLVSNEDMLLLKFLVEKKARLEDAIESLESIERAVKVDNEEREKEIYAKAYPDSDPAATTVRTRTAAISQDLDTSLSFPSSSLHQDDEGGTSSQSTSRSSSISAIEPSVIEKTFATVGTQTDHLGKKLTEEQDAEKQGASHHDQVEEVQKAVAGDGVITASVEKISSASDELAEESIGLIKLSPEEKELYEEYKSKISNKDPREKLSAGLTFKKLLESLSSREHPDLESNFEKEPFEGDYKDDIKLRHIRDFTKHHKSNFIVSFNNTLRSMYREDHGVFKQALTEYLVSREIATERLGGKNSHLEDRFLLKFVGEKKTKLEDSIESLESLERAVKEDKEESDREYYAKKYPGLTPEEAMQKSLEEDD
ncbi:MAG: hypothetical protein ACOYK6_02310 [Chthoniobacterales bacterium]